MRSRLLLVVTLVALLLPTAQAGQASGELTSDAPVSLYGDGRAVGTGLHLYHHAFREGSLAGKVYSGLVVEHAKLHVKETMPPQPPECDAFEGRDETQTGPSADPQRIYTLIDFGLSQGSFARLTFPGDALFSIGEVGAPKTLDRPFLYLGPNPYRHETQQSPGPQEPDARWVPAFATEAFAAVPAGPFNTFGPLTLELEWGTMKTIQGERERTHRAGVFDESRETSSSNPLDPTTDCLVVVSRWVEFQQTVVMASIDQAGTDRTLDFWHGGSTGQAFSGSDEAPPEGYWDRGRGADFAHALEELRLPASLVAGPDFHLAVDGEARFDHALGSVSVDGRLHEVKDGPIALQGQLNVQPEASEDGHRMTTRIGDEVSGVIVGGKAPGLRWTLDVPVTLGFAAGLAALGAAAWAWPALKFKGTQWLLFPLYARLKKEDLLENPLRDDILDVVQRSPGISASELGRRLECGWGTLVYHLTVLERMQLISSAREGRHKRFFVQGRINYSDKAAVGLLANASARTLLDAIRDRPGLIQRDLGRLLGLSPGTVAWHVDRLEEAGLILKEEDGRVVRYYPSAKLLELTRQLAA
jgi:DNA-binding transcriptional ArsR family regulator